MPRSQIVSRVVCSLAAAWLVAACADQPPVAPSDDHAHAHQTGSAPALASADPVADSAANHGTDSHAMHLWRPGNGDTCSEAIHARHRVIGPDGKWYPTWHPPVDPETGCRFGHEHGRDPRGSALFAEVGWSPFGYGAERLMAWQPGGMRHEDHVGHKIEWENDVQLHYSQDGRRVPFDVRCHWLTKFHQGTHSNDAFANNTHELNYHVRCTDGTAIDAIVMARLGPVGRFERACEKGVLVAAGLAPQPGQADGRGTRLIPDRTCALRHILVRSGQWSGYSGGLYENWGTANYLRTADGREIAYFDPGFAVFNPARYQDPGRPDRLRHTIDLCYETIGSGRTQRRARGGECDWGTDYGRLRLAWTDPRSPFTGTHREVYFNQTSLRNAGGPEWWYTDPYGGNASPRPFAGAIRQRIAPVTNLRPWPLESQAVGADRRYGGNGVHAPN
jgi:hypothetical protein